MLDFARERLDIVAPAADLLYANAYEQFMQITTSGFVVGKAMVDGVSCDHLAFRGPDVDWQVWIAEGDRPLPRRYVVTTTGLPSHPEYTVTMTNWNVAPNVTSARFSFTPPAGAKLIDFLAGESGVTRPLNTTGATGEDDLQGSLSRRHSVLCWRARSTRSLRSVLASFRKRMPSSACRSRR